MKTKSFIQIIVAIAAMTVVPRQVDAQEYEVHTTASTKTVTVRGGVRYLTAFSSGRAFVKPKDSNWFVIDKSGNNVFDLPNGYIPAGVYEGLIQEKFAYDGQRVTIKSPRTNGLLTAAIINTEGKVVKEWKDAKSISPFVDGLAVLQMPDGRGTKNYYIDRFGKVLSETIPVCTLHNRDHCEVFPLSDGLRMFYDGTTRAYGFMDEGCNIVIEAKFKQCGNFHYGLAKTLSDERLWGYIDKTGKFVIEPNYTKEPGDFNDTHAMVYDKAGKEYLIDRQGQIIWSKEDRGNVYPFFAKGAQAFSVWNIRKFVIVSKDLKKVDCAFKGPVIDYNARVVDFNDKWIEWKADTDTHYLIYHNGQIRLKYGQEPFSDGLAADTYKRDKCYINDSGVVVMIFKDTQF